MSARVLPNNATPIERALEGVAGEVLSVPVEFDKLWSPDECPATHIHILAATFAVEVWNASWDIETKRAVIRATPAFKRVKGTIGALRRALGALGLDLTLTEWFQTGGQPYTFRITLRTQPEQVIGIEDHKYIVDTAIRSKNVRSWLEALVLKRPGIDGPVYVGATTFTRMKLRNVYDPFSSMTVSGPVYAGAATVTHQRVRLQ